ncbi:receptor-like protein 7 [Quercus suber]|uniref:receptor-like protein 7 n=1 Tax=Quercus suber TaxID=58331 RepID=UPI0032DF6B7A
MESWKDATDCCSWDGVTCDSVRGDVIGPDLSCSWLYGTIPPTVPYELSQISQLASLDLSIFHLSLETSVVKRLVQNLTKLRDLHLDFIDMSSVSLTSFMNLSSSLMSLSLKSCELQGRLPDNIFRLPNLRELNLFDNSELTGDFPLSNWSNPLRSLDLSKTAFSGELPKSIGNLKFLRTNTPSLSFLKDLTLIDLRQNNFGGEIPDLFPNLTKLTDAYMSDNQLTGNFCEFQFGSSLQFLTLDNNRLYGCIPKSISNLVNISELDISSNNLSGIVNFEMFTKFKKIGTLALSHNSLSVSINKNFNHTFPALRNLELASCNITNFPNFLNTSFLHLDLSDNKISGRIPEYKFGTGKYLMFLNLAYNFLSSIELLQWENLRFVDLRANLLQGQLPIPPSLVDFFSISNNRLSGEIPLGICTVSDLSILDISNNNLSGIIPRCLGNLGDSLSVIDLSMNSFQGTIPETLANCTRLNTVSFNGNQLEGLLPPALVNCTSLEVLDLGNNKINGSFPYWLEELFELHVLVLRSNRFHGPIGIHNTSGMFFSKLQILDLSHNEFTGLLPSHYFGNMKAMMINDEGKQELEYLGENYFHDMAGSTYYKYTVGVTVKGLETPPLGIPTIFTTIDLSSNKFQGEIPGVLASLNFLRLLNLSHNSLTGSIPSLLANLSALESLDLSSNRLVGEIPMQLTSLTFLALLNLSQNHLTGPIPQGKQFATFQNDSYDGNLGLCGFPLSKQCSTDASPLPPPSIFQEDNDSMFASGFGWKAVLIGYGCGLVFGLAVGYVAFKTEKPQWLVRFVEGERNGKTRRPNNKRLGRRS